MLGIGIIAPASGIVVQEPAVAADWHDLAQIWHGTFRESLEAFKNGVSDGA